MADETRDLLLGELTDEERKPLTPRQERFVEEYLVDLNGTQAAIRAGYSPASAASQASDLLKLPKVRARIDIARAERAKRVGVNAERLIEELARIALIDPLKVLDTLSGEVKSSASQDDTAAIQSVKVKVIPQRAFKKDEEPPEPIIEREVRLYDKTKAIELLGKFLGIVVDKREITGKDGGPIQVQSDLTAGLPQELIEKELARLRGGGSE